MSRTAKSFWWVIAILAVVTLVMTIIAAVRAPTEYNPPATKIAEIATKAARSAFEGTADDLQTRIDQVYAPVYAAIPGYLDFHYSVYGEYAELGSAALGNMSAKLEELLYNGFDERFATLADEKDQQLLSGYIKALRDQINVTRPADFADLPLGAATEAVISDATSRLTVTVPLATATLTMLAASPVKAVAAVMAKKLGSKVAAKAAAKGVAKGAAAAGGFGTGALACSWSGPFAVGCGAIGAAIAWFGTDAVVISLDEYFNRDEFAAELVSLIDRDKESKLKALKSALNEKLVLLEQASEDLEKTFTLDQLNAAEEG